MATLKQVQQRIGYQFRAESLLRLALTHPSVFSDRPSPQLTNQRLEFLGDAVLQLVLTRELYDRFPALGEGTLTKARARLVNRRALASHGRQLRLGEALTLSRGEEQQGGRDRTSSVADAFEAVVGAISLDGGFEHARAFVLRQFDESLSADTVLQVIDNPKGELQELLQSTSASAPRYSIASARGPDHDREFECVVVHEDRELARGQGKSKKEAESRAALKALKSLRSSLAVRPPDPSRKVTCADPARKANHEDPA